VLTSTKNTVHILQLRKGSSQMSHGDYWINRLGKKEESVQFDDIIAWAKLPAPYGCLRDLRGLLLYPVSLVERSSRRSAKQCEAC
jgi:hypothetical protein